MAVDLYVGTLTRYYACQWENVAQKMAREQGLEYRIISPQVVKDHAETDPADITIEVENWQRNVSEALHQAGGSDVVWQEDMEQPYFTDRIGWDPLLAVMLWTSCIELGKTPPRNLPKDMMSNPALVECLRDSAKYQLTAFLSAQFWLPADFMFFARFQSPAGDEVGVASVDALLFALEQINERSWRCKEWRMWLKDSFPDHTILETPAKYGFAVLASMAVEAKRNRLPMVLSF